MKSNIEKYRRLAEKVDLPLQLQPWWWDALCNNNWSVALVEENNGDIVGALPYQITSKAGIQFIQQPPFTTYSGPWIKYPTDEGFKMPAKLAFEKKVFAALANQIPRVPFSSFHLSPKVSNCLPFLWEGFSTTTRYTYLLDLNLGASAIFENFKQSLRTDLRKPLDDIQISKSDAIEDFYPLLEKSYANQGSSIPYPYPILLNLFEALKNNNTGQLYLAFDEPQKKAVAGLLVGWDHEGVHALASGQMDTERPGPVMAQLFWKAIQDQIEYKVYFDFEGSMIENIEHFLRGFGGTLTPYYRIYRSKTPLWEWAGKLIGKWS